jgi:hypothetical protein
MKKALIGIAAGAMALGASVVPASAGWYTGGAGENLWDAVQTDCATDAGGNLFEQLVLSGGWAERLDTDGNGEARYTVFQPLNSIITGVLAAFELEISDLNSQPAVVQGILADHIANGSFDPDELEDKDLTRITMRSGFVAPVFSSGDGTGAQRVVGGLTSTTYIAGALIVSSDQVDNGYRYCISGFIDSTPNVSHEGLNSEDTPQDGTPGGTNSLPDTL